MKKFNIVITGTLAALCMQGCYDDYVSDYEYSGVYVAYQYDLRTFVIGEDPHFDFTVALAGVLDNKRDRLIDLSVEDALVTGDLSEYSSEGTSFTALQGMLGTAPAGQLSQSYVSDAMESVTQLTPLPASYYSLSGMDGLKIAKGSHTAKVRVSMQDAMTSDPAAFSTGYAIGFRVNWADADTLLFDKSFAVIGVRCENKFYGNWYHGGRTVVTDGSGAVVSESVYNTVIPQPEADLCVLTTVDSSSVRADKMGPDDGDITLTFADDGTVSVSSDSAVILSQGGSRFNGERLLQDRKIFLSYSYRTASGHTAAVTDTLTFRNRVRDGVNEWQDENQANYK